MPSLTCLLRPSILSCASLGPSQGGLPCSSRRLPPPVIRSSTASLDAAKAYWPPEAFFISPEIDETLTIWLAYPLVDWAAWDSSGMKAADANCPAAMSAFGATHVVGHDVGLVQPGPLGGLRSQQLLAERLGVTRVHVLVLVLLEAAISRDAGEADPARQPLQSWVGSHRILKPLGPWLSILLASSAMASFLVRLAAILPRQRRVL